jgi:hypothetical protein
MKRKFKEFIEMEMGDGGGIQIIRGLKATVMYSTAIECTL